MSLPLRPVLHAAELYEAIAADRGEQLGGHIRGASVQEIGLRQPFWWKRVLSHGLSIAASLLTLSMVVALLLTLASLLDAFLVVAIPAVPFVLASSSATRSSIRRPGPRPTCPTSAQTSTTAVNLAHALWNCSCAGSGTCARQSSRA